MGQANTKGYLEKLSFGPNSALRANILFSEYQLYACGKIFTRALILNQNPNFARYPKEKTMLQGVFLKKKWAVQQ
jgi:hypothetical protein